MAQIRRTFRYIFGINKNHSFVYIHGIIIIIVYKHLSSAFIHVETRSKASTIPWETLLQRHDYTLHRFVRGVANRFRFVFDLTFIGTLWLKQV